MTKIPSFSHNILRLTRCTGPSWAEVAIWRRRLTPHPPQVLCPTQGTIGGSATSSHLHAVQQTWTCGPASAAGQPCSPVCLINPGWIPLYFGGVCYVAKINF